MEQSLDTPMILELLENAKRPILLVGDGVRQANEVETLGVLSSKWKIPILSSRGAQDVGTNCDNYFGYIGSHGIRYSNFIFAKADLVLSLGNRLAFPVNSKSFCNALKNKWIIRVELDKDELKREIFNSIVVNGDLTVVLKELIKANKKIECESWLEVCQKIRSELFYMDVNSAVSGIADILRTTGNDCILVSDVGNNEFWLSRAYEFAECKSRILYSKSYGALGCGIGKAIGAYYSSRKNIIYFTGDQGFQVNIQELQLISLERIPIGIVLVNNSSSGMIRDREIQKYKGHLIHVTKETGYGTPDFVMLANAYHIPYQYYRQGMKISFPALIELKIPEEIGLAPGLPKGNPMQAQSPLLDTDIFSKIESL